jgi:hypothetical protein
LFDPFCLQIHRLRSTVVHLGNVGWIVCNTILFFHFTFNQAHLS